MKTRTIISSVLLFFVAGAMCLAANPNMGTWKLNEAKSKLVSGVTKNSTVVFEAAGDSVKVTIDGTDASGKPVHSEWTGKLDGKDLLIAVSDTPTPRRPAANGPVSATI